MASSQHTHTSFTLAPIAWVRSCFVDKFGIPRQPGLAPSATAILEFDAAFNQAQLIEGLEQFSHLWLIFIFHQHLQQGWKPTVRPPRLGGNQQMGVWATRSTYRPNHLGLSVVKLDRVSNSPLCLHISGHDLVDGTPIVDIKPYLPYSDALPHAMAGYAQLPPIQYDVIFSEQAQDFAQSYQQRTDKPLTALIIEVLQQDPRPAYHQAQRSASAVRPYFVRLWDVDVTFSVCDHIVHVLKISSY